MSLSRCLFLVAFLGFSPLGHAQSPSGDSPSPKIQPGNGNPGELTLESLAGRLDQLEAQLASLTGNVTTLAENSRSQLQRQESMVARIDQLEDTINAQLERQKSILDQISRQDSSGTPIVDVRGMMSNSEEFKQDLHSAVFNDSQGTLSVTNRMSSLQELMVFHNGVWRRFGFAPNETKQIPVAGGTVSTRLPNQPIVNWTVSGPSFRQSIEIVPEAVTTANYMSATSYTAALPTDMMTVWP